MKRAAKAVVLLALLTSSACKSGKPLPLIGRDIPARSPERIIERIVNNSERMKVPYYSAKATIDLRLPTGNRNFKALIRSVTDSAAWISVIPALGIEAARLVITEDSVKLLNRIDDQYFLGDTTATLEKFKIQPDLDLLQDALLGLPIGLEPNEKYRSDRENGQYVLTSKEKRRFVRAAEDISPSDTLARDRDMGERRLERTLRKAEEVEAVVFRYWLEPDSMLVTRVQIADLVRDQVAEIDYLERGGSDQYHMPTKVSITLTEPGRQATAVLELSRIVLEGPLQMNFSIPEKFVPMP
ncbi:MAG: DUF4292 domain-containing protein [Flavobacteriales bacterium]|nr:DUF4292 domain-containing protein [Flavobacteriales bacterium]MBK6944359.1 DUF4292 domain-containing protein [Flavobacteriales bacterium]MBK7242097.1 DUF4292 domain-containing protein [Flavobacteriales bacterium]MBK9534026.1 DUF4292 domain-containing protein [Flavobacteriales bacterium]MBP9137506.1 DUF4292 domain-containing protein [Flavobacteriales bacterium]